MGGNVPGGNFSRTDFEHGADNEGYNHNQLHRQVSKHGSF